MDVEIFNPTLPKLNLVGESLELAPFSLQVDVWAIENFGSIKELLEEVQKPSPGVVMALYELAYFLLVDKSKYKTYEQFLKIYDGISAVKNVSITYTTVLEIFDLSAPIITDAEKMKSIAAKLKSDSPIKKVCYVKHYDTIASRYHYSIEQFYKLTLRQLHAMLSVIEDSKYEELEVQAALQGRKLEPRMEYSDISEEQQKKNKSAALEAHQKLVDNYNKNQKGD